jgi:phosphoribosylanthranilate isomerase
MKQKIKICGMKYQDNINDVAALQPDFMGFIFYKKSPRNFENQALNLPKSIKKVGVFVNETYEEIASKAKQYELDFIQLHGEESPEFCEILESNSIKVIKSFNINKEFNFSHLKIYENYCSYFLFDTKSKLYGGNGISFDWSLLQHYQLRKPYFLSGGIGPESTAILKTFLKSSNAKYCFAIDLNSKFESSAGIKQTSQLSQFIKEINHENQIQH